MGEKAGGRAMPRGVLARIECEYGLIMEMRAWAKYASIKRNMEAIDLNRLQKIKAIWSLLPWVHQFAAESAKESKPQRGRADQLVDGAMIGFCLLFLLTFGTQRMDEALVHARLCFELAMPFLALSYIVSGQTLKGRSAFFRDVSHESANAPEIVGQLAFVLGILNFLWHFGSVDGLIISGSAVLALMLWLASGARLTLRKLKRLMKEHEQQQQAQTEAATHHDIESTPGTVSRHKERGSSDESGNMSTRRHHLPEDRDMPFRAAVIDDRDGRNGRLPESL